MPIRQRLVRYAMLAATRLASPGVAAATAPPRIVATNKDTGRIVWETGFPDTPEVNMTSAPLPIRDKIIVGAAGGDNGVRDWIAGLDAASGKLLWRTYTIPAPGEPGSET